jgi:hypothetical protein
MGKKTEPSQATNGEKPGHYVYANQPKNLHKGNVSVYIPANTFYDDTYLDFDVSSDTLKIDKDIIPLQKSYSISFDISNYNEEDKSKLFIAKLVGYYQRPSYINTTRKGNSLIGRPNNLGTFTLETDNEGPKITPINFYSGKWISKENYLKVKIVDKLSGISSYRATINGKWILMEYDYKTDLLTYDFDDKVISETEHNLKLIVTDNVGNSSTFEATFFRK